MIHHRYWNALIGSIDHCLSMMITWLILMIDVRKARDSMMLDEWCRLIMIDDGWSWLAPDSELLLMLHDWWLIMIDNNWFMLSDWDWLMMTMMMMRRRRRRRGLCQTLETFDSVYVVLCPGYVIEGCNHPTEWACRFNTFPWAQFSMADHQCARPNFTWNSNANGDTLILISP